MTRLTLKIWASFLCGCFLVSATPAVMAADINDEQELRAKMILELPRYVEHSHVRSEQPTLCVVNSEKILSFVKTLNQKKMVYANVIEFDSVQECDFIYLDQIKKARQMLSSPIRTQAVLISDYQTFINEGGVVGLVSAGGKIRIELNLTSASLKGVKFSPDLIELSWRIIQ